MQPLRTLLGTGAEKAVQRTDLTAGAQPGLDDAIINVLFLEVEISLFHILKVTVTTFATAIMVLAESSRPKHRNTGRRWS